MEKFEIIGENGFVRINLTKVYGFPDTTSAFGGYDTESEIEIKSSNYYLKGVLWVTTGNIFDFFQKLEKCQKNLVGIARLETYEKNLQLTVEYDELGHVIVKGKFIENHMEKNILDFEIKGDQTFMNSTINELENIYKKYGNNKGIKNSR
nr:hypothetical protein [uncultured Draconibacterium sp.]